MAFDIDQVLEEMAGAAADVAATEGNEVAAYAREVLGNQREALARLAEARIAGDIDDNVLERLVDRELRVAEAEFLALDMMTRALKERAWNAARGVFVQAVKAAVRTVL